jgi:hypothetical protein
LPVPIPADGGDELFVPADLASFKGAPFADDVVGSVGAAIVNLAGWHIAPAREEAVEFVRTNGSPYLFLSTMHLTAVRQVLDVTADPDDGVEVADYRTHPTPAFRAGIIERPAGWPVGVLRVTYDHGHAMCPRELLAVGAEMCRAIDRGELSQRSLGDRSESWRDQLSAQSQITLTKFKLPRSR